MSKILTLFPEASTYEEKAFLLLKTHYDNGNSYRATGRVLNLNHSTVKAMIEDIKMTDIYMKFISSIEEQVASFKDSTFTATLFERYEAEVSRLEKLIQDSLKVKDLVQADKWLKLKLSFMKDQLKANLFFQIKEQIPKETNEPMETYKDIYNEAIKEFGVN